MTRPPTTAEALVCGLAVIAVAGVAVYLTCGHADWTKTGRKHTDEPSPMRTYVVLRPERLPQRIEPPHSAPMPSSSQPKPVAIPAALPKPAVQAAGTKPPATIAAAGAPKPKLLLPVAGEPAISSSKPVSTAKVINRTAPLYVADRREVGRTLLGSDGKKSGTIPPITMDYQQTLGWNNYVRAMQQLGGLFFIFDRHTDRVRGMADLQKLDVTSTSDAALRGLSPRLREIEQEPVIVPLMARAQAKFGPGDYSLVLLLPLNVDFDIVGGIARHLADAGTDIKTVARVVGEYERGEKGLRLHARGIVRHDSTTVPVDFSIDL